ncbi:MAG: M16 family metallopeptidase, partial [Nannocystaceae bacterium]
PLPTSRGGSDLAGAIEALGGDVNAFTSHDETVIYASVPRRYARAGLRTLLEHGLRPALDDAEIEREREVILEEISEYEDDHVSAASDGFLEGLFSGSEYGRPILGRREDVRILDAARLRRFHSRTYTGDGIVLVVAGSMDSQDVLSIASPLVESLPPRGRVGTRRVKARTKGQVQWQRGGGHESHLRVGWQTPALTHQDAPAMDVISAILSQGESALLQSRVRRQAKVVSDIVGSVTSLRDAGSLMISAETVPGNELEACDEIVEVVRSLCLEEVSEDVLGRAKAQILCAQAYRTETMEGLAHGVGHFVSQYGELEAEARYFESIRDVGAADVQRVARRWIGRAAGLAVVRSPHRRSGRATAWGTCLDRISTSQRAAKKLRIQRHAGGVFGAQLASGLRVRVLPDGRVPVVASTLVWEGGGRLESRRAAGGLWLATGLLTRGS